MSTIVRAIDVDGDWTFGAGQNNYLSGLAAVTQDVKTRLQSFLGDCFFDLGAGVDWFNLMGSKNQTALIQAISVVILNTPDIVSCTEVSVSVDVNRRVTVVYSAVSSFGTVTGTIGA